MIFTLWKLFSGGVAPSLSHREIAMPDEIDKMIAELPPVSRRFRGSQVRVLLERDSIITQIPRKSYNKSKKQYST